MNAKFLLYCFISLLSYICISCSEEDNNLSPISEAGLAIHLDMGNSNFTRVISDSEMLYDWQVDDLHVFIFDSDGNIVSRGENVFCYWHFGKNVLVQGAGTVTLMTGNWKDLFENDKEYDVYAVANLYEPKPISDNDDNNKFDFITDLSNIKTFEGLKKIVDQNYQVFQSISDIKKLFTMSGCVENWDPISSPNVYTLSIPLTRIAARIEVNLEIKIADGEIEEGYSVGIPQFELLNYSTNAPILSGYDDTFSDRMWASDDELSGSQNGTDTNQFVTYTYPNEWNTDILHETYVLVNVPFIKNNDVNVINNYYKVPLRLSTDDKRLERNHWYKIKAIISSKGNIVPDKPVELTDVHYEVAPWNNIDIDINGDTPMYLELSEYDVVMRNVDTYDLTFASSSQITSATINNIYYINKNGKPITVTNDEIKAVRETGLNGKLSIQSPIPENKTIRYMTLTVTNDQGLSKEVTIKQYPLEYITGIAGLYSYLDEYEGFWPSNLYQLTYDSWAVDKNTEQQYIINKSLENSKIVSGLNENIGNNAVMKSKFYVENESGEGRIFRIDLNYFKEYEKVPAGKGNYNNVYTYKGRNKGNYTIKATESLYGDYTKNDDNDYIEKNVDGQGGYTLEITNVGKNSGEYSHSYVETKSGDGNYVKTTVDNFKSNLVYYLEDNGTASNNQMYHVVITSTSEDYQLGRPIMDEEDEEIVDPDNLDNDNLVSPSFMLASQLGNSSTINWEEAKEQCKNYVEVSKNGKVYDDWRLPTAAEIGILIKYQSDIKVNTGNDYGVMDNILNSEDKGETNPYYWVSSENKYVLVKSTYNKNEQLKNDRDKCRVRCIRDFHVGEPTE